MGHKVNPISFRLGINKTINSLWYMNAKGVSQCILEDSLIRKTIAKHMSRLFIDKIIIKRIRDSVMIVIHSVKNPNLIRGEENLKSKVQKIIEKEIGKSVVLQIDMVKIYDLSANYHVQNIANQLENNIFYKRVMRRTSESAMAAGALGVKVLLSGRLGGSEMSRVEKQYIGSIPLHSLAASIDYAQKGAKTTAGIIGIKVWINRPNYLEKKAIKNRKDVYSKREKISQAS